MAAALRVARRGVAAWGSFAARAASSGAVIPSAPARFMSFGPAEGADMFCMQCEQTESGSGCTTVGVCGKTPETAALQDGLVHVLKGVSYWSDKARTEGAPEDGDLNKFVLNAMFSTLTNVNFDPERITEFMHEATKFRASARARYEEAAKAAGKEPEGAPEMHPMWMSAPTWTPRGWDMDDLVKSGLEVGVQGREAAQKVPFDSMGLQELIVYGLKGLCAYAEHTSQLGVEDTEIFAFVQHALATLARNETDMDTLVGLTMDVGGCNVKVLAALDGAHTSRYGHPVPTPVNHAPTEGKAILVSGHDMRDLEDLLQQTEGTGVNVYTHGEMLPAHGYPGLKEKYPHLIGQFGGPWQLQKFEFPKFPGPIVMTTNCIIEPRKSYKERIYTMNAVGWPGVTHIPDRDFSKVIAQAQSLKGFTETAPKKEILTGFGHNTVMGVADKVLEAVSAGDLKRIVLIGGCDGSEGERSAYTDLASQLPDDALILTLGCGKYRVIGKKDYGTIGDSGIPRMLDMGQCNDSYSAVVVATELAKALDTDINSLPLSIVLSWFEQKAVAVLLSLLHLGVKGVRIGPNLPAFITPAVLNVLVEKFDIAPVLVDDVDSEVKAAMGEE